MIFWEYLRIYSAKITAGGAATWPRGWRARLTHLGAPPWLVGPRWPSSTYPSHHTLHLPHRNTNNHLKHEFQVILLRFSISLLKAPLAKLLGEIVPWYVTPPLVQLVFALVLYSLQICAAQVTMFLSLHVKFIWFQVVLMLDIGSRHLQEQLLSILLSLVHFYFEVTKISEYFRKIMRRFLSGSKRHRSLSIICHAPRRFGRVNGLLKIS